MNFTFTLFHLQFGYGLSFVCVCVCMCTYAWKCTYRDIKCGVIKLCSCNPHQTYRLLSSDNVNRGSSKQDTDFHILFLSESESMIHCFSTCLYIVLVNGTSCAGSVFTKPMLAYFPCHVLCKILQMAILYSRENILTCSNHLFCMSLNR